MEIVCSECADVYIQSFKVQGKGVSLACPNLTRTVVGRGGAQTRFVGMMQYDGDLKLPSRFLVPPPAINGVSGELLAKAGVTTFACSETQKFGHVSPLCVSLHPYTCS